MDGTVKIWDTRSDSKKLIKTIAIGKRALKVAWSPSGNSIAIAWIGKYQSLVSYESMSLNFMMIYMFFYIQKTKPKVNMLEFLIRVLSMRYVKLKYLR